MQASTRGACRALYALSLILLFRSLSAALAVGSSPEAMPRLLPGANLVSRPAGFVRQIVDWMRRFVDFRKILV